MSMKLAIVALALTATPAAAEGFSWSGVHVGVHGGVAKQDDERRGPPDPKWLGVYQGPEQRIPTTPPTVRGAQKDSINSGAAAPSRQP